MFGIDVTQCHERGVEDAQELIEVDARVRHVKSDVRPADAVGSHVVHGREVGRRGVEEAREIGEHGNVAVVARREALLRRLELKRLRLARRTRA